MKTKTASTFISGRYYNNPNTKLVQFVIILCLMLIILTLSIMNGFERELRNKILALIPHIELIPFNQSEQNIDSLLRLAKQQPNVIAASRFTKVNSLLINKDASTGGILFGIESTNKADMLRQMIDPAIFEQLANNNNGVAMSELMANRLKLKVGSQMQAIALTKDDSYAVMPLKVVSLFNTGTEVDSNIALIDIDNLLQQQQLAEQIDLGVRLQLSDPFSVYTVGYQLRQEADQKVQINTWFQQYGNLYTSIQTSKIMVVILVLLICFVACFNLMVMMITIISEKEFDVAILITFGIQQKELFRIFSKLAMRIALTSCLFGVTIGIAIAKALPYLSQWLQQWTSVELLNIEVYPLNYIPSGIDIGQIVIIVLLTLAGSYLAALYPAIKASRVKAVQLLNLNT